LLGEVEKLNTGGVDEGEADAVNLAEQRTKRFANAKRVKTSTPADADGLIWSEFLKGNQQRFFCPCPACGKSVVLAWSPDYTIFRKTGREAWVKWDKEARRPSGEWDLDRVMRSARAVCPHCGADIEEKHKTRLVRAGAWEPTGQGSPGFESYQLPSLYAVGAETAFGALAVKFLKAKRSPQGVRGFVTGDLAEPMAGQGDLGERVELFSREDGTLPESVTLLTVDVQQVAPYFWAVARAWRDDGDSRLVWAGHFDEWETLRSLQLALGVEDRHVIVDSGHRAQEVYENCLRWGRKGDCGLRKFPLWRGWMPAKGRERDAFWVDKKTKLPRPYFIGSAALPSTVRVRLPLLEFNGEHLLGWLQRLRKGPEAAGHRWELVPFPTLPDLGVVGARAVDADEYFRHLNSKTLKPETKHGKTVYAWRKRSESWPDHLLDCEIEQLAGAMLFRRLPYGITPGAGNEKPAGGDPARPASLAKVAAVNALGARRA
jgi:ribosomal protein S27AE